MNWLLQQPLVILVAGAVVELMLFFALQQTGKKSIVAAMAGVALLVGGLLVVERFVVTPEEAIRAMLHEIAGDAQRNDVEAVVQHISRRAPQDQLKARAIFKLVTLEEVKLKQFDNFTIGNPPDSASARVRILAVGGMGGIQHQRGVREFDVAFVLEDDIWKVRGFDDLGDPLMPGR